jgi:hypothetical protein
MAEEYGPRITPIQRVQQSRLAYQSTINNNKIEE